MRWLNAGGVVVLLAVVTGCIEEYGREGRIAKAIHKDALERIQKKCSAADLKKYCAPGKEKSPECLKECGGK